MKHMRFQDNSDVTLPRPLPASHNQMDSTPTYEAERVRQSPSFRIAVLIPSYNDSLTIASVVYGFRAAFPHARIYVYDNNSSDDTARKAAEAGAIVRHESLQGKGLVMRRMFQDIKADFYVLVDGDGAYDLQQATGMISPAISDPFDMVNGVRISEKGEPAYRVGHQLGNMLLTGVVIFLFGNRIEDMLSGYKVFSRRSALLIYLLIALAYFWWPIHDRYSTMAINYGIADLGQNLWYLKWWPYAISHGLNPYITYKMWHAYGYNLTWQTSLPGLSFLALPITATAGVVIAYNTWIFLSFALTAWTTYILCYHVTRQFWASLVGGYLFGFSGYMLAQATGHIHLIILFPLPLVIYLAVLRYEKRISRVIYLALTPLPLLLLFVVSVEEFALIAIFSYLTLGVFLLFDSHKRRDTFCLSIEITAAFFITAIALSPYLYYMAIGYSSGVAHPLALFSGDALGFVIPTNVFLLFSDYFHHVPLAGGNRAEQDSYLGLPLAFVMMVFAIKNWNKPIHKTLTIMALIGVAFTLGPKLFIAGTPTISSPMKYIFRLPLIQKSLPIRYAMFVDLAGALMAAIWLANGVKREWVKVALGLTLILILVPNVQMGIFFTPVTIPTFFSTTMYQRYIKPDDTVLILPLGLYRTDLLWQQAADFNFNMPSGYGASTPPPETILPIERIFNTTQGWPDIPQPGFAAANRYQYYMEQYVATEHINDIVVQERYFSEARAYLMFLHETPLHVGGVWYYRVSPSFSQAKLPSEHVSGEPVSRPYNLSGSAYWDGVRHRLVVPAHTAGTALTTLADIFPGGKYTMALTIHSVSHDPVAYAEVVINGSATPVALTNGVTHFSVNLTGKTNSLTIRIISLGGATFTIGDATMTKA